MNTLTNSSDERIKNVEFSDDAIVVSLMDGRVISVPLAWYPSLSNASKEQLNNWEICRGGYGIHWPEPDEDLSSAGFLRGVPDVTKVKRTA